MIKSKWIGISNPNPRTTREPIPAPKMHWGARSTAKVGDICPCCWSPFVRIDEVDELVCACDLD